MPTVSIIIPVYKAEHYLDACMRSVVGQSCTDLEILLVDDGSPDRSPEMCDAWAARDPRVRVLHRKNGGAASARNAGLDAATGDFIFFADADDLLEPDAIEYLVKAEQQYGTDLVIGNMLYVDAENHTWTTDNFLKAVQAVYDSGKTDVGAIYCSGQGGDQGTRAIINNMYGGTFTDAAHTKYTADSAENVKAIETLYNQDGINFDASINGGEEITLFRNGTLQMAFCWNIAQQTNADNSAAGTTNSGDDILFMAFPTESGDPALCGGIWGFGVFDNGDENKIAASKTFINFMANSDETAKAVKTSTYFSVKNSLSDLYADDEVMNEYQKLMPYLGDYYQVTPGWAEARTAWWNMLQQVGEGADVTTAVTEFCTTANAAAAG